MSIEKILYLTTAALNNNFIANSTVPCSSQNQKLRGRRDGGTWLPGYLRHLTSRPEYEYITIGFFYRIPSVSPSSLSVLSSFSLARKLKTEQISEL